MKIRSLTIAFFVLLETAWAAPGTLLLSPATTQSRGPAVNTGPNVQVTVEPPGPVGEVKTATLGLTRAGRPVGGGGEIPLRKQGKLWVASIKLEFPGAHVLSVRLYEGVRVWSAALDLTGLDPKAPGLNARQIATSPLEFEVTEGKPGNDANPWLGVVAMLVLATGVFLGTRNARRPKTRG